MEGNFSILASLWKIWWQGRRSILVQGHIDQKMFFLFRIHNYPMIMEGGGGGELPKTYTFEI